MNTSKKSFKELAIPFFREVFALIDEVMAMHHTPFYLIGATAISLQLLKEGLRPARGTKDIDFAVMVSSFAQYDAIKTSLKTKGFESVENPLTLYHTHYKTVIDLLPFGEVEEKDTKQFVERQIDLVILGFNEALGHTEEIELGETLVANVPALPAILMLKLISWHDRPEWRSNDLYDLYLIISKYFDMAGNEIFELHSDLLNIEPFDREMIAARLLGRKIAPYIKNSKKLKNRVLTILNQQIERAENSEIAVHWTTMYDHPVDYGIKILSEIKQGIIETL